MRSRLIHCKPRAMFNYAGYEVRLQSKTGKRWFAQFWRTLVRPTSSFGAVMHALGFPESFVNLAGIMDQRRPNAFNGM